MIKTTQELLNHFGNIASQGFLRPVFFNDPNVIGFSIQKNYPKNIKFTPAVNKRGEDDSDFDQMIYKILYI